MGSDPARRLGRTLPGGGGRTDERLAADIRKNRGYRAQKNRGRAGEREGAGDKGRGDGAGVGNKLPQVPFPYRRGLPFPGGPASFCPLSPGPERERARARYFSGETDSARTDGSTPDRDKSSSHSAVPRARNGTGAFFKVFRLRANAARTTVWRFRTRGSGIPCRNRIERTAESTSGTGVKQGLRTENSGRASARTER